MKLARMRIRNFRCYRSEISVDFDDFTAIIGRNDSGKSTIMDALEIFLNDGTPDRYDGSRGGDPSDLTIICEFVDIPASVVIDEDYGTSLGEEYLLNTNDRLEIHKTYSGHLATPKCTSIAVYANHPTAEHAADLLQLKNSDLKKRATSLGLDLSEIDQKINAHLRSCVRNSLPSLDLQPRLVLLNDNNAKRVWEGIRANLPVFALFRSDRPSTDQDPEAQDPLKTAVREAIKQKEEELNALTTFVEEEVKRIAFKTLDKLREMDPSLAQELNPQITVKKWDSLFGVSITGDEDIPVNKRGSGVKRLILLNFFRAKAEQAQADRDQSSVIYAIEEPETSQHPHNQRLLLNALREIAADHQVIITTHTPMLARALPDTCLRYIYENPDKTREIRCGGGETNRLITRSLGILPDNAIRLFVGVEGKHDIAFLKNIAKALNKDGCSVMDLEAMELKGELMFVPLGGSSLALWVSRLENLNRPEFYLFDRDYEPPLPAKYHAQAAQINSRVNCTAVITKKREMENYIHFEAIELARKATSRSPLGLSRCFGDYEDVPSIVAELVHGQSGSLKAWQDLDEKQRDEKSSKAKKFLNNDAASMMTRLHVDEVDPDGEILTWFRTMQDMAN